MPEAIQRLLQQLRTVWTGLGWSQRLGILGACGAVTALLLGIIVWGNRPDLTTLYANLNPTDAGMIVEQLKAGRISYKITDNGTRILVPASQVHETRLKLAAAGLPQGGGVGFELFDRSNFGATDFVQKLNYQRALQGELARTIGQIHEVQQARVHIAIPQPTIYSDREKPVTASVVLSLRPGGRMNAEQVRAIVHLVSASVEGLDADRVTVIDSAGRILSQRSDRGAVAGTTSQFEYQTGVEAELQRRVQSMLEEVLGPGKSSVRVAAQLEFSHGERTEERIDPNSVVKSESRSAESSKSNSTRPAGVPGTTSNIGSTAAIVPGTVTNSESLKEQESTQYEVGRVVERRTLVAGEVKRLSVAVLVDPPYKMVKAADGTEQKVPTPRDPGELEKLRSLVMKAVGFNAARGDEVEVAELAFDNSALERERVVAEQAERTAFWWSLVQPAATALIVLCVILFGLRPLLRALRRPRPAGPLGVPQPSLSDAVLAARLKAASVTALNPAQAAPLQNQETLRDQVAALARTHPDQVAQLLRGWMGNRRT